MGYGQRRKIEPVLLSGSGKCPSPKRGEVLLERSKYWYPRRNSGKPEVLPQAVRNASWRWDEGGVGLMVFTDGFDFNPAMCLKAQR